MPAPGVTVEAGQTESVDPQSIALCLSGGGLRATLFHLGVLKALRAATINGQMALKAVREVYAVSGGSIIAAHFLVNYGSYVGDDKAFAAVERKLLAFAGRDLRNRVLRRWPFHFLQQNARGRLLQQEYEWLLQRRKIGDCYRDTSLPMFHFLSTSFTTGALCSFSGTRFEQMDPNAAVAMPPSAADGISLSFAVAASSAFPPMFPPVLLTPEALGTEGDLQMNSPIQLSDGGVYDNTGVIKFSRAIRNGQRPAILLVSNAGGSFAADPNRRYGGMLSRNIRASDILMRRVGESTFDVGEEMAGQGLVLVRIGATIAASKLPETSQQRIKLVRTDLDRFGPDISGLLVEHGERVARQALSDHRKSAGKPTFEVPAATVVGLARPHGEPDKILVGAAKGRWLPLLADYRDPVYLFLWWSIIIGVLAGLWYMGQSVWQKEMTQRAKAAQTEQLDQKLEAVRLAAVSNNMNAVKRELAIAIETNTNYAKQPDGPDLASPKLITEAQVEQIINPPALRAPPPVNYGQNVYIQYAGSLSRAQISQLNEALRSAGWKVQGSSGELIQGTGNFASVKYDNGNEAPAEALAAAINNSGLQARPVRPVSAKVGPDLEIWISN